MPSGKIHTRATLILSTLLLCKDPVIALGAASGVVLSPDLDLDLGYIGIAHFSRIPVVGRPIAFIWRWLWKPYAVAFAHRSMTSHGLIISTAIRVCYIAIPFFVLNNWIPMSIPAWLGRAIIGLVLADCLHIAMDAISTAMKPFRN